jgi:RNA polymerase sigma-70 factor, ECF subfamily
MPNGGQVRHWFESEVMQLLPHLTGTALRMARNATDAEDLVADTVARAWRARDSLQDRTRFRQWIMRIMTNAHISVCRARAAQPVHEVYSEESEGEESFSLFDRLHQPFLLWWGNPEREFLNKVLREDLARAIDALPEQFRLVVVLAELQGMSYQQIAETLEVPVGTVRSRLARTRGILQRRLWEHGREAGLVPAQRSNA